MMNRHLKSLFVLLLISTYCLLFYSTLLQVKIQDFTSLYSAMLNLVSNKNPYANLFGSFLPGVKKVSMNLNPPIVLWIFSPLAKLPYQTALTIWIILSFFLGLIGASIAFYYAVSASFFYKKWLYLLIAYLALFSTMMNAAVGQFGAILLFIIMLGYHFYLTNRSVFASILWGLVIAFKFFPALLFFYVLKQRRIKVFFIMMATTLLACLIPYFLYGQIIYTHYFSMMSHVYWYGDSWNASLFGYFARPFISTQEEVEKNLIPFEGFYLGLLFLSICWYLKKLGPANTSPVNHQPFCLTLTLMLFLSPLGWLYYFPLLIFPLILTFIAANEDKNSGIKPLLTWVISLLLINFPIAYIQTRNMPYFAVKISFFSCYFYGLILLNHLCANQTIILGKNELYFEGPRQEFILISLLLLMFGMLVTTLRFFLGLITN